MTQSISHAQLITEHLAILKGLQYESGLFAASKKGEGVGYDKAWLRDNFYECLAFEVVGDYETVCKTYRAIFDVFKKHEDKIDWAISQKPEHTHQYIHPRYDPVTFEEYWEEWGNKQHDSIGCVLFKIGELEKRQPGSIVTSLDDIRVIQKLISYLESVEYWSDADSGMWEENQELHASSVGACVAGLKMARHIGHVEVPDELIAKGEAALAALLPRESESKFVDLALLPLIWPYAVTTEEQTAQILANVEYHLVKDRGVIRYKGDRYFNKNVDGISEEAEWTFGLSWLAIIYQQLGEEELAQMYLEQALATSTPAGMPELYYSNSPEFNENTPLGWSESLLIVALHALGQDDTA